MQAQGNRITRHLLWLVRVGLISVGGMFAIFGAWVSLLAAETVSFSDGVVVLDAIAILPQHIGLVASAATLLGIAVATVGRSA